MGTIVASTVLAQARAVVHDNGSVKRHSDSTLVVWLSAGQRKIVFFRPEAGYTRASQALGAGTNQSLPADGQELFRVTRNTGGATVTPVSWDELATVDPGWYNAPGADSIEHFIYEKGTSPRDFKVYPPANAGVSIELEYAAIPADLANESASITLSDEYQEALLNYLVYRIYDSDSDSALNTAAADRAYARFLESLGLGLVDTNG
jgi:hypothetical protein